MKYLIFFLGLFSFFQASLRAQQTDDNTLLIQKYFESTTNKDQDIEKRFEQNQESLSYVMTVQVGNDNKIYINSLQSGDNQVINQTGTQNNYEYYNYYSQENTNMIINQEGTLNSLQIFGENSLMKNAKINQKSDFKSIVIKNYTN